MITDDIFISDPCRLQHHCIPTNRYKDKATRVAYEACQTLKKDKMAHRSSTSRHYSDMAHSIVKMPWRSHEERKKVVPKFIEKGFTARRKSFARAKSAQMQKVEMTNVPEDLRTLPGVGSFLQVQTQDLHINCSKEVIEMACENGLFALVGDGIHKLNLKTTPIRMDKGQLYTVHAVCSGEIEVPILYAITRYKTFDTYRKIFQCLKELIRDHRIRIVLDFEKAAIRAAREMFRDASVEGCSFHLAQAWNRMAQELGLRQFVRGPKKVRIVSKWWKTINGGGFLPIQLTNRVPALMFPPGMWCNWDMQELMTTNSAEAFQSTLRNMLGRRVNPPFEELVEQLQTLNTLALGTLLNMEENARASKRLREKDRRRREKIHDTMDDFKEEWMSGSYITTVTINRYCRRMSRYVTEKTI